MIWVDAHERGDGSQVEVRACEDGHATIHATRDLEEDVPVRACLTAESGARLAREVARKSGASWAQVLGVPDDATDGVGLSSDPPRIWRRFRSWAVLLTDGKVKVESAGDYSLTPADARTLAAILAEYADAAESEPDPAEVEALAGVLRASSVLPEPLPPMYPDLGQLARAVLLAGWKREAGNA